MESSQQIEALVERFSRETNISDGPPNAGVVGKIPLAYGKPGEFKVWGILYIRLLASTFSCGLSGLKTLFLRVFALPLSLSILWLFYSQVGVRKLFKSTPKIMINHLLVRTINTGFSVRTA